MLRTSDDFPPWWRIHLSGGLEMGTTGTCQMQSFGNPRQTMLSPRLASCCVCSLPVTFPQRQSRALRRIRLARDQSLEVGTLASNKLNQMPDDVAQRPQKPSEECAHCNTVHPRSRLAMVAVEPGYCAVLSAWKPVPKNARCQTVQLPLQGVEPVTLGTSAMESGNDKQPDQATTITQ